VFKNRTLFVVGAGASKEANLPIGAELKQQIGDKLNILFPDGYNQSSGDPRITQALRYYVKRKGATDINPYRVAGVHIYEAMHQAISIDNFLDAHRDDEKIQLCGKLGIASCILEAERNSLLYVDDRNDRRLDYRELSKTWYGSFQQLLTENVFKSDIDTILENVSFITFNYDRCIEHFLAHSLSNYYRINFDEACRIVSKMTIQHPYGAVGRLPWQPKGGEAVDFGANTSIENLLNIAGQLKTFTERVEDEDALAAIRREMEEAHTVVFLGFSFGDTNMDLIKPGKESKAMRVYGTGKGISESDIKSVRGQLLSTFGKDPRHIGVEIRNDLTCAQLFGEYWRSISRD
jgi:hypothetical protein